MNPRTITGFAEDIGGTALPLPGREAIPGAQSIPHASSETRPLLAIAVRKSRYGRSRERAPRER
jgi:hypothetical protein